VGQPFGRRARGLGDDQRLASPDGCAPYEAVEIKAVRQREVAVGDYVALETRATAEATVSQFWPAAIVGVTTGDGGLEP